MKTLILMAHPHVDNSYTQQFLARAAQIENVTWHSLDFSMPFDVAAERNLFLDHDRIIFQFPLYWYSAPASLKEWEDLVLADQFDTMNFNEKQLGLVISTGQPSDAYERGGTEHFGMGEITTPFQAVALKLGMTFLPPLIISQFAYQTDEEKAQLLIKYQRYLTQEPLNNLQVKITWLISRLNQLELDEATKQRVQLIMTELQNGTEQLSDLQDTLALIKREGEIDG